MSDSTVSRALEKGLENGFIALTKRGGGTGSSRMASNYRFLSSLLPGSKFAHREGRIKPSRSTVGRTPSRSHVRTPPTSRVRTAARTAARTVVSRGELPTRPKPPTADLNQPNRTTDTYPSTSNKLIGRQGSKLRVLGRGTNEAGKRVIRIGIDRSSKPLQRPSELRGRPFDEDWEE
jgi:hypothetical protein